MTVFVALIFQVLFVFFAMAINIGLVIHDKINLQNSVDLGAYYGAQKVAEVLNAMAHINFQIRQDYKLLAYRMRVIGGLGYDNHPGRTGGPTSETPYADADTAGLAAGCIAFRSWREVVDNQQNICRSQGHVIRELPRLPIIAGFIPINAVVSAFVDRVRDFITQECRGKTELNWNYVAGSFYAYRIAMFKRKEAFKALALNLARPADQMVDMDGNSILLGVQKTIEKNLTYANANKETLSIEMKNGLEMPVTTDLPPWLSEIFITPQLFYVFHDGRSGGCTNRVRSIRDDGDVGGKDPTFDANSNGEPNVPRFHSSLGFEKNPWIMAWIGVKATAQPRKPFAPFGDVVQLKARAFAKPFGGRIGPWFKKRWDRGAERSGIGNAEIDPLLVPRISAPGEQPNFGTGANIYPYVPNYSKYPGDRLGLKSNLAMTFVPGLSGAASILALRDFSHFVDMPTPNGDPLSFGGTGLARNMELAAVAPDLFDITYYSVEPRFNALYGSRGVWQQLQDTAGGTLQVPLDLGTRLRDNQIVSAKNQVEHLNAGRRGNYFYFVANPNHLLTGWHQKGESDYSMDLDRLGKCDVPVPSESAPANPGNCIKGGRTGYSVKLVSRDYLLFEEHAIGGEGSAPGGIMNPPDQDF